MTTPEQPSTEDRSDEVPRAAEVTIKGPGVQIVRPVDDATMANVIALLFGVAPTSAPSSNFPPSGGGSAGRGGAGDGRAAVPPGASGGAAWDSELTLGEFLVETGASSFPQKICAAGYYLIKIKGAESFDREDIKAALVQSHEDLPANYSRDFGVAASSSLIAQKPGESGQYFVPTTGRKAVESHFQEVPKRRVKSTRKAATNAKGEKGE